MQVSSKERWQRIVQLFGEVKDLTSEECNSYWKSAAKADLPLRNEIEKLIAEDVQIEHFLDPMWSPVS